jgi:hypothetical protein
MKNTCDILRVGYTVVNGLLLVYFKGQGLNSAGLRRSAEACFYECYKMTNDYGAQKPLKISRNHLYVPGATRVTRSKSHTEAPQILVATVQNIVARTIWCPRFVQPCIKGVTILDDGQYLMKDYVSWGFVVIIIIVIIIIIITYIHPTNSAECMICFTTEGLIPSTWQHIIPIFEERFILFCMAHHPQ